MLDLSLVRENVLQSAPNAPRVALDVAHEWGRQKDQGEGARGDHDAAAAVRRRGLEDQRVGRGAVPGAAGARGGGDRGAGAAGPRLRLGSARPAPEPGAVPRRATQRRARVHRAHRRAQHVRVPGRPLRRRLEPQDPPLWAVPAVGARRAAHAAAEGQGAHVLHRRHPLREGLGLPQAPGARERLPARGRHPPLPRALPGRWRPVPGQELRLRPARDHGIRGQDGHGAVRALPGAARHALGHALRLLPHARAAVRGLSRGRQSSRRDRRGRLLPRALVVGLRVAGRPPHAREGAAGLALERAGPWQEGPSPLTAQAARHHRAPDTAPRALAYCLSYFLTV
ncbi:hypothetical protein ON010_g4108 [Phytophthora cinnamomi]|nr:hypothetical protein ON010_g4108 [Phytophthora cinnamomi]